MADIGWRMYREEWWGVTRRRATVQPVVAAGVGLLCPLFIAYVWFVILRGLP